MTAEEKVGDGGPAFPGCIGNVPAGHYASAPSGMSLRDYFAGQALVGVENTGNADGMASWAYRLADAMLAERSKNRG